MERHDWLLLFLSRDALGSVGPEGLDPIRIQKGMFLLSKRGPARNLYFFRPYNWGPFSSEIYADLEGLEAAGLARAERVPGRSWRLYRTTPAGHLRAESAVTGLRREEVEWLGRLREFVTERSFERLLRDIYSEYPEYARRSLLR